MKDIQGKVFSDFEAPATTDGSYWGGRFNKNKTKEHYDMKFEEELHKVNQRLKASKSKVTLSAINGGIQLRATLPLKPDETHKQGKDRKQYMISLGIPANFDGLETAEEEAHELGKLIARKTFTWTDKYLGQKALSKQNITFAEFYEVFEKKYFETRKRTMKSEHTFSRYIWYYKKYFLNNICITESNVRDIIQKVNSPSCRNACVTLASFISEATKISINLSGLRIKYKSKKRNIPTDKDIESSVILFEKSYSRSTLKNRECSENWRIYKTAYSLMAIYGLRPREIFNQPDLEWLMSPENKYNTFKVHESNKTGYREVFPFVPEWIELFDLKNKKCIEYLKKFALSWNTPQQLKSRIQINSTNFLNAKVPFAPYDLRHACAIRAHLQGVPIKAAADNLGHTVDMHTNVYQQWFGLENRRKAFNQTFETINEVDVLKLELNKANKRIAELELENTRLRLNSMK